MFIFPISVFSCKYVPPSLSRLTQMKQNTACVSHPCIKTLKLVVSDSQNETDGGAKLLL